MISLIPKQIVIGDGLQSYIYIRRSTMYIIPGYVDFNVGESVISITNHLTNTKTEININNKKELFTINNKGTNNIQTELEKFLFEKEMLDDQQHIEETLKIKLEELSKHLTITVMLTERCNFSCKYCYDRENPKTMTDKKMDNVIKYIVKLLNQEDDLKSLNVLWIGGEPLLEKQKLLMYGSQFKQVAEEAGVAYNSELTTNGYFLDADTFEELLHIGINKYYLAFDGRNHDYLRPLETGEGTSKTILKNLVAIKTRFAKTEQFEIEITNNIMENNRDFAWYDKLKILLHDNQHFIFKVKSIDQLRKSYDVQNELTDVKVKRLLKEHYDYLDNMQMRTNRLNKVTSLCSAGFKNGYVFRSDGLVVKCNHCLTYDFNNVGIIANDDVRINEDKNKMWAFKLDHDKCILCKNVLKCGHNSCPKVKFSDKKCSNFSRPIYEVI